MGFDIHEISKYNFNISIKNFSDKELIEFMTSYKCLINRYCNKIKIIFDASLLTNISFKQVKILSIFLISMKPIHREKLDKFAIVIVNKYVSNILNFIFVVIPPVRPYSIVNNIEEAKKYID